MKNIELLTVESYFTTREKLIENVNYKVKELESEDRYKEILGEIGGEYFGELKGHAQWIDFYIEFIEGNYTIKYGRLLEVYDENDDFCKNLQIRYQQLIQEKRETEILDEIKINLPRIFVSSCLLTGCWADRIYEIIKYTLTDEAKCDLMENGKFIGEMEEDDIYPFKKEGYDLPKYAQEMQKVLFGVHRKIFVNPKRVKSDDITKFSFYNTDKIVREVTEVLQRGVRASVSMGTGEDKEGIGHDDIDENGDYIEGEEDYILLDRILGISLTNIVYWKTRNVKGREIQDRIIRIVRAVAKCHYVIGRNLVMQVLLDYLQAAKYESVIINKIESFLVKNIKVWNEYYKEIEAVHICPLFGSFLKEKYSLDDYNKECKAQKGNMAWEKYMYMDEIKADKDMLECKKVRIPKKEMDSRTWYAYIHKCVFEAIWS